jgi:hypothetical protein
VDYWPPRVYSLVTGGSGGTGRRSPAWKAVKRKRRAVQPRTGRTVGTYRTPTSRPHGHGRMYMGLPASAHHSVARRSRVVAGRCRAWWWPIGAGEEEEPVSAGRWPRELDKSALLHLVPFLRRIYSADSARLAAAVQSCGEEFSSGPGV